MLEDKTIVPEARTLAYASLIFMRVEPAKYDKLIR